MISIEQVVWAIIYLIIGGVVFWLLTWLIDYIGLPEPFRKVARVVLAVGAVLVVIAVLLAMAGHPIVRWGP